MSEEKYVPGGIIELIDPVLIYDETGKLVETDEFGKVKSWTKDLKKGEYTDDTILTLALAESIAKIKGLDLNDIAKKQLAAVDALESILAFGRTTQDALYKLRNGISPLNSGVPGGPGNAPCMKIHPLGLYMHAKGYSKKTLKFAEDIGRITHLDPRSIASGVLQTQAIYLLLNGITKKKFISTLHNTCVKYEKDILQNSDFLFPKAGSLKQRINWVQENMDVSCNEAYENLGCSSRVYESYPFTLFMFQKFWDAPIEGLFKTINYGGDCDTTAAMYGALAGAKNGMIFPQDQLGQIKNLDPLITAAKTIWRLRK